MTPDSPVSSVGCSGSDPSDKPTILIPVFNDWDSVSLLLPILDRVLCDCALSADVVLIDDGSIEPPLDGTKFCFSSIGNLSLLKLRRNLGHQRAIAIALAYWHERTLKGPVILMDGDGEDDPADVPRLIDRYRQTASTRVIFAQRLRRSEGLAFRLGYHTFRMMHRMMTGMDVRQGNFSLIPASLLARLVVCSELWNHYAATVMKARLPVEMVPTARAKRLSGQSKMNFPSLVVHGLSAISVHSDVIGVRLLLGAILTTLFLIVMSATVVGVGFLTGWNLPDWGLSLIGLMVLLTGQFFLAAVLFAFLILNNRQASGFIPLRDHRYFVQDCTHWQVGPA